MGFLTEGEEKEEVVSDSPPPSLPPFDYGEFQRLVEDWYKTIPAQRFGWYPKPGFAI